MIRLFIFLNRVFFLFRPWHAIFSWNLNSHVFPFSCHRLFQITELKTPLEICFHIFSSRYLNICSKVDDVEKWNLMPSEARLNNFDIQENKHTFISIITAKYFPVSQQNSLCFPWLEKVRTKFPVFPVQCRQLCYRLNLKDHCTKTQLPSTCLGPCLVIITARKQSCGKVMFSQAFGGGVEW